MVTSPPIYVYGGVYETIIYERQKGTEIIPGYIVCISDMLLNIEYTVNH